MTMANGTTPPTADLAPGMIIRDILVCPLCGGELTWGHEGATCPACSKSYPTRDGIHDFSLPEQDIDTPALYGNPHYRILRDKLTAIHIRHYSDGRLSQTLENQFKQHLIHYFDRQPDFIADIGCGTGSMFRYLGDPRRVIGIDINLSLLKVCRDRHPLATLVCCDITRPPLRPGSLPALVSVGALEHMFYLEAVLTNLERILAPEGRAYVLVPTEGGAAWTLARNLFTMPTYCRDTGLTRRQVTEAVQVEHCNSVFAIDNAIRKHFKIDRAGYWPLRTGGPHLNLIRCYRLTRLAFQR